nr:NADPH cytochrome P450 oxidoreductase family protein [Massilia glaciei]
MVAGPDARPERARRRVAGRDRRRRLVAAAARQTAHRLQQRRAGGPDSDPGGQRKQQHLGLRPGAARRLAQGRAAGPYGADEPAFVRLWRRRQPVRAHGNLWRRRRPASADQFLALLGRLPANRAARFTVLGFGDRQFPKFCQFARDVDGAMAARGWQRMLELETIDRQSMQQFARWGEVVGEWLGIALKLEHAPAHPRTVRLRLLERVDYGPQEEQPTVVLRFGAAPAHPPGAALARLLPRRRLPHFEAGDLAGMIVPGSPMPRFYSLASGARDGILEICV